jgi:hypothetical protein
MKNIQPRHCSSCGNTDEYDVDDNYSTCCNENVVSHSIEFLGEFTPGKYYPNGTNAPGVEMTCENQGECYHN